MKKVLVLSHSGDHPRVETVCEMMREKGAEVIRLDADKFLTEWVLSSTYTGEWQLKLNNGMAAINANEITAVWLRRLHNFANEAAQQLDTAYRQTAISEANLTFTGFISSLTHAFHLNHYMQNRVADIKTWQLKVAAQIGLNIPKTCISNDPETVRQFIEHCGGTAIAKMHNVQSVFKEGNEYANYTSKIEAAQIDDSLRFSPMIFQEFIPKVMEYRVTIVGKQAFVIGLDTSINKSFELDWRREGEKSVQYWTKAEIPQEIIEKLFKYMDYFHINYGAADILLSPDGKYSFLEMNPAGEFDWVNGHWKGAVCEALANVLIEENPHRPCSPYFAW